jgi:hypothetical protein
LISANALRGPGAAARSSRCGLCLIGRRDAQYSLQELASGARKVSVEIAKPFPRDSRGQMGGPYGAKTRPRSSGGGCSIWSAPRDGAPREVRRLYRLVSTTCSGHSHGCHHVSRATSTALRTRPRSTRSAQVRAALHVQSESCVGRSPRHLGGLEGADRPSPLADRPSPLSSPLWRNEWNAQVTPSNENWLK